MASDDAGICALSPLVGEGYSEAQRRRMGEGSSHGLPAIELDHDVPLEADEVEDIGPERHLSPKLDTVEAAIARRN